MPDVHADRRGMLTLTLCTLGSLLALSIGWVLSQLTSNLHAQLAHAAIREEMDRVGLQALEESAYLVQTGRDPNGFLRGADAAAPLVPNVTQATLSGRAELRIAGATARVLARHREAPRDARAGKHPVLPREMARLDLPWDVSSRAVTWGVVELAVTLRRTGRLSQSRRVARRHLFVVVDYHLAWDDRPKSYACLFPDPLATTFE